LRVGDTLLAVTDTGIERRAIIWVGRRAVVPRDRSEFPVRIVRHAIADNVPFQDLLVTQDHCLFLDDMFVPVRLLVNNRSIFIDETFVQFDVYHVETAIHSVILANGVMTESFLDVGNKMIFTPLPSLRLVSDSTKVREERNGTDPL